MKKTYTNPLVVLSGSVMYQTLAGSTSGSELAQPLVKFTM